MHLNVPAVSPDRGISLTYEDLLDAVDHLRAVNFPLERSAEDAWPDFVGWRVNYEATAFAIAKAVQAPPALWSGPRTFATSALAPIRPPL
jgi:hypothetical protein